MPNQSASPASLPPSRRHLLLGLSAVTGLRSAGSLGLLAACDSESSAGASGTVTLEPTAPPGSSSPALGVHGLVYNRDGVAHAPLSTKALATRTAGSTVLVCVGRGVVSTHANPTDNKGNAYLQVGSACTYTLWPTSGTALYVSEQAAGGAGYVVTAAKPAPADETTLSVVEVINGGQLGEVRWSEVLAGRPQTSESVTTTGPALLVAWWWGDANVKFDKTAVPDNGFTVIDAILLKGALVQCAVAVRQVSEAGTWQVNWTATPLQGAQLWIAAVRRRS